jgi:simple sugar transport system ATP-binding protein
MTARERSLASSSSIRQLVLDRVSKRFGGVVAVDEVSLTLEAGKVHAVVGENGAGKSTLMHLLYGIHRLDGGWIEIDGERVDVRAPRDAVDLGIAMVHQHERLVSAFTVTENLVMARRWDFGWRYRYDRVVEDTQALSEAYHLDVQPSAKVADLSLAARQRAEILIALDREASVVILDEPTTVLSPSEVDHLLKIARQLADEGKIVVFISHRLQEVFRVSDRISVMRRGRLVKTWQTSACTTDEIVEAMVGHPFDRASRTPPASSGGANIVEFQGVTVKGRDEYDRPGLREVSFAIRSGEILGVAGVAGNGQSELVETLLGSTAPDEGQVVVGAAGHRGEPDEMRTTVGIIPEDRHEQGLVLSMSVAENLLLGRVEDPSFSRAGILRRADIASHARRLMDSFDIRAPGPDVRVASLSGGNQQKIVLARAMDEDPEVLLAVEPTRGLDLKAAAYVLARIRDLRDRGTAVLYIASDLDELLSMSDRVIVLFRGRADGPLEDPPGSRDLIGRLMAGLPSGDGQTARASDTRGPDRRPADPSGRGDVEA